MYIDLECNNQSADPTTTHQSALENVLFTQFVIIRNCYVFSAGSSVFFSYSGTESVKSFVDLH